MISIKYDKCQDNHLYRYIGTDGMLAITVPATLRDVEVVVVIHPVAAKTDLRTTGERGPQDEHE